jgi:hypothetical protein
MVKAMATYSSYSSDDLRGVDPVQLGLHGFCFVAARILADAHPEAGWWRLTDNGDHPFAHVFVCIDGEARDVRGKRTANVMAEELRDTDPDIGLLSKKRTSAREVEEYFRHKNYSREQLQAVREVLTEHLGNQPGGL